MRIALPGNAAFTGYWVAETLLALGQEIFLVAVGWQIYDLTDSALSLGLIGLAQFLPQFLLALPAGHVADNFDRRRITALCQIIKFVAVAAIAAESFAGAISIPMLYACTFVFGVSHAFQQPALRALMPTLVARNELAQCIAWTAGAKKAAIIAGPALGGLIYLLGPVAAYAAGAVCFLAAGVLLARIRLQGEAPAREPMTMVSLFGGISFIRRRPVILGAMSLDLFAVLLGGATALLPVYARDILEVGPGGLGLLRAAPAIGAVLVSLLLIRMRLERGVGRTLFASIAVFGLATVVFGFSRSFELSFAALVVLGASDMVSMVIRQSLVQLQTPDGMRGRVGSVHSIFTGTSNQLGQFESGVVAAWLGSVASVVIGGVGTLLVCVLWIYWFPALWKVDRLVADEALPGITPDAKATGSS
ncbi:MAG: major Facilitator Superfamily protein [Betaproteobacteria bacterium]|nr:major Facilitator Superfamily protein [Betaproteobacteria bacterium]